MINFIFSILRNFSLYICCFYGYVKLANIKPRLFDLLNVPVAALLATGLYFATDTYSLLVPIIFLISSVLYFALRYKVRINKVIVIATISCGIALLLRAITIVFSFPLGVVIYRLTGNEMLRDTISLIIVILIQFVSIYLFFNSKRLKGKISKATSNFTELLLLFSAIIIFLLTLAYAQGNELTIFRIAVIFITFFGLIIIVWRYRSAKYNYRAKLAEKENADNRKLLTSYRLKYAELTSQNELLAKIVHKNNKIIPSLIISVSRIDGKESAQEVMERLKESLAEHTELIDRYNSSQPQCPQTGITSLNGVFGYILTRAQTCGVDFGFEISPEAVALCVGAIGNISLLNTIVCDLCENALHSAQNAINGRICAVFDVSENSVPRFCIYDNGAPFDQNVIANLGVKRYTTRESEGGSGIGLYTLFEILKTCNASFCIDENPSKDGFTKCVIISFDNLSSVTVLRKT